MELLIREYMAISFLIVTVSHILHWDVWSSLFEDLSKLNYAPLLVAIFTIPIGLFIVLNHNIWEWHPSVMITIFGWSMTIKGVIYALHPNLFHKVVQKNVIKASSKQMSLNKLLFALVGALSIWILLELYGFVPSV